MSITPELRNAAFSAYRQLFRAARFTFRGASLPYPILAGSVSKYSLQGTREF